MVKTAKKILFWQPEIDFFHHFSRTKLGPKAVVVSNYLIWFFLFYISYLLIRSRINIFWQLLIATVISEIIEKKLKIKKWWFRPLVKRQHQIPAGLLTKWYQIGSFPSGHAIKATFFFLYLVQYAPIFSLPAYFVTVFFLVAIRIPLGFHYPIDLLGGIFFGIICWYVSHAVVFPEVMNQIIQPIFNFFFFI